MKARLVEKNNLDFTRGLKPRKALGIGSGHLTSSSSSVFNAWVDENMKNLTIKGIKSALDDLWPRNTDEDSKISIIHRAEILGIK